MPSPFQAALARYVSAERRLHEADPKVFLPEYVAQAERELADAGDMLESEVRQLAIKER